MSKVEELGGGVFNCFDDCGICVYTFFCPYCQLGQSLEDAGEQSCAVSCLLSCCIPCWYPIATSSQQETVDKKMGGQGMGYGKALLCQFCCGPCSVCRFARAVKKAKAQGLLRAGAPQQEEMTV